jgi:hypothetical protein
LAFYIRKTLQKNCSECGRHDKPVSPVKEDKMNLNRAMRKLKAPEKRSDSAIF